MDWWHLFVGVVVIVGWIINNLQEKGNAAGKAAGPKPPPLPPQRADEARPARAADSLQDFLNEVRRRKRAAEEGTPEEPLTAVLVEERPRRVETVTPPPLPKPPPAPKPAPPPVAPMRAKGQPGNTSRWTEPPLALSLPPASPEQAQSVTQKEINASVNVPAIVLGKPGSPATRNMLSLLKNRQSLATAFLLREVLDVPLCKRRRRRAP